MSVLATLVRYVSCPAPERAAWESAPGRWANIGGRNVWLPGSKIRLHKPAGGHVYEVHGEDAGPCEVYHRKPKQDGQYDKLHIATVPSYEAACNHASMHSKALDNVVFEKTSCECCESEAGPIRQLALELGELPNRRLVYELAAPGLADGRNLPLTTGAKSYADRIDRTNRIIRGVKICGEWSRNPGRILGLDPVRYGKALDEPYSYNLRNKAPIYEGAAAYKNHRPFEFDKDGARIIKSTERDGDDLLGWFRNTRYVANDGIYGDFHYLESQPFNARVLEVAERAPDKLAFSHEAEYAENPQLVNGRIQLEPIGLDGVALVVSRPGTTRGIFESVAA